jgi:hypothetical protein
MIGTSHSGAAHPAHSPTDKRLNRSMRAAMPLHQQAISKTEEV